MTADHSEADDTQALLEEIAKENPDTWHDAASLILAHYNNEPMLAKAIADNSDLSRTVLRLAVFKQDYYSALLDSIDQEPDQDAILRDTMRRVQAVLNDDERWASVAPMFAVFFEGDKGAEADLDDVVYDHMLAANIASILSATSMNSWSAFVIERLGKIARQEL